MKWTTQYGVHRLSLLNGHFSVVAAWVGDGYGVTCFGHTLKKKFKDLDEAKVAGVVLAKKLACTILAELGEVEKEDG